MRALLCGGIDPTQVRLRQRDKPASTAPTHDEQGHVVDWRTRFAKPGDIPQDAVSHSVRTLLKMIPERTDQAFFLVFIASRDPAPP